MLQFEQLQRTLLCKGGKSGFKQKKKEKMKLCPYDNSHFFKPICWAAPCEQH